MLRLAGSNNSIRTAAPNSEDLTSIASARVPAEYVHYRWRHRVLWEPYPRWRKVRWPCDPGQMASPNFRRVDRPIPDRSLSTDRPRCRTRGWSSRPARAGASTSIGKRSGDCGPFRPAPLRHLLLAICQLPIGTERLASRSCPCLHGSVAAPGAVSARDATTLSRARPRAATS